MFYTVSFRLGIFNVWDRTAIDLKLFAHGVFSELFKIRTFFCCTAFIQHRCLSLFLFPIVLQNAWNTVYVFHHERAPFALKTLARISAGTNLIPANSIFYYYFGWTALSEASFDVIKKKLCLIIYISFTCFFCITKEVASSKWRHQSVKEGTSLFSFFFKKKEIHT